MPARRDKYQNKLKLYRVETGETGTFEMEDAETIRDKTMAEGTGDLLTMGLPNEATDGPGPFDMDEDDINPDDSASRVSSTPVPGKEDVEREYALEAHIIRMHYNSINKY